MARAITNRWFKLINEYDFVTYMVSKDQVGDVVETFSKCQKPIFLSFHKNKFRSFADVTNHITKLTNLIGLEIEILREPSSLSNWMTLSILTDLQVLKILQHSQQIPHDIYGHLKGLTSLEDFKTTDPRDLSSLQNLSNLYYLDVDCKKPYNPFNILPCPEKLTQLTAIGHRLFWEVEDLDRCSNLRDLIYDEMKSKQLFPVGKLTNLDSLGITAHDIDEYPSRLTYLSVQAVPPRHLTKLTSLQFLRIDFSEFWPENEKQEALSYIRSFGLTELQVNLLDLDHFKEIGSEYVSTLMNFTKLKKLGLDLEGKEINGELLSKVINSLPNLVSLDLSFPRFNKSRVVLEISTKLIGLQKLEIYGGQVEFEDPTAMTALKSISFAAIANLTQLGCLTSLETLNAVSFAPHAMNELTKLERLKCMTISKNNNSAVSKFTNLESLILTVEENLDFGTWTDLTKLTWIDLMVDHTGPLSQLTLLTSLQLLTISMETEHLATIDKEELFKKLPKLYDIDIMDY